MRVFSGIEWKTRRFIRKMELQVEELMTQRLREWRVCWIEVVENCRRDIQSE